MSHTSNHRTSCELAGLVSLLNLQAVMDGMSESPIEIISGGEASFSSTESSSVQGISADSPVGQPFCVMFLNTRISRCQGCRGKIEQGQPSSGDVVLQHKEYVLFQNQRTAGSWQMLKDM